MNTFKVLNILSHHGNANQNDFEILSHLSQSRKQMTANPGKDVGKEKSYTTTRSVTGVVTLEINLEVA